MTAQGYCEKCKKLTGQHFTNEPRGWFCSEACRAVTSEAEPPLSAKKHPPLNLAGQPNREPTPEEIEARKAEVEKLFHKYLAEGAIAVHDPGDGPTKYIVATHTHDKEEAVEIVERLIMSRHFDRIKQICFVNGMVDGITTCRREIRKIGGISVDKAIRVCNQILAYLERERVKI